MTKDHAAPEPPGISSGIVLSTMEAERTLPPDEIVSDFSLAEQPAVRPDLSGTMRALAWLDKPFGKSVTIHDYREALQNELAAEVEKAGGNLLIARQNHLALVIKRIKTNRKLLGVAAGTIIGTLVGLIGLD